jgi:hypothetical protein
MLLLSPVWVRLGEFISERTSSSRPRQWREEKPEAKPPSPLVPGSDWQEETEIDLTEMERGKETHLGMGKGRSMQEK